MFIQNFINAWGFIIFQGLAASFISFSVVGPFISSLIKTGSSSVMGISVFSYVSFELLFS